MKLYMFRAVPLPIIRSLFTTHSAIVSYRFEDRFRAGPGWSSILFLLEICLQTCMTCTIAERTATKLLMTGRETVRSM
jgi:hypothetical protein